MEHPERKEESQLEELIPNETYFASRPTPAMRNSAHQQDYPPNRLLFLRNVSATTNKTAIRADMQSLLGSSIKVDYVDWSKGNDTVCSHRSMVVYPC
jgi:hypothetical protein